MKDGKHTVHRGERMTPEQTTVGDKMEDDAAVMLKGLSKQIGVSIINEAC